MSCTMHPAVLRVDVHLRLRDTAGQEEYNAMQEAYYRTPMLDFMVWVSAVDTAPELDRMRQDINKFRAVRHISDNQPLPAFFVVLFIHLI